MSSILKALEKAEESNSTRRAPSDDGLIRSRKSRPAWIMPGAVLCAAVLATLATFTAMGGFSRHTPPVPAPLARGAAPVAVAPANPVNEAPATTVVQSLPVVPEGAPVMPAPKAAPLVPQLPAPAAAPKAAPLAAVKAAPIARVKAAPVASVKAAPVASLKAAAVAHQKVAPLASLNAVPLPARKVPAAASRQAAAQPAPQQIKTTQVTPVAAAPVAPAPGPARPELKVSGIAWQNSGASSFAVVNGRAVLQGSMVDGYKVQEIRHDAVRFSGSGGTFEVPLGDDK